MLKSARLIEFIAYDEEDDGFAFTRTRAKKAKADAVLASTTEKPTGEERTEPAPTRKPRKKATGSPSAAAVDNGGKTAKRRSPRHSGEHENADPPALIVKKRRKDRASSELKHDGGAERLQTDKKPAQQEPQQEHTQPSEVTFDATKIALPFADTPIIRRNKEMRKTNAARRSSLGMRGRRASSLIDTGKSNGIESTRRRHIVNADRKISHASRRSRELRVLQAYSERGTFGTATDEAAPHLVRHTSVGREAIVLDRRRKCNISRSVHTGLG